MTDMPQFAARLLPSRPDLAAEELRGKVDAPRFATGQRRRVTVALLDLRAHPERGAERATQLIRGESFTVYEVRPDGFAWGQAATDGYVGYVETAGLGPAQAAPRRITALWSQVYDRPLVRAATGDDLPFLAAVDVAGSTGAFARLRGGGFVPSAHLAPVAGDFVTQAERLVGSPYLWGGRSPRGIDCSGLVQLALAAVGTSAPRDSDMQAAMLGVELAAGDPPRRGDLWFWKGHVGILRDPATLLHANAHHMAVAVEPLAPAVARIEATGGGRVLARRRIV